MARIDDLLREAVLSLGPKPPDADKEDRKLQAKKKNYSEGVSRVMALACAEELRRRGLEGTRPGGPGDFDSSGAERRMAGGIGAKKVDVTWATEESGLLFAISVKTINFRDLKSNHFQKNLTNRRGDLLAEAVTLHRRFPYAVLFGLFFFDKDAATDGTPQRNSTFKNAHDRFRIFTGRSDPAGRDEQYERLYVLLLDAQSNPPKVEAFLAGNPETPIGMEAVFDEAIRLVAERNSDFYECRGGQLVKVGAEPGKRARAAAAPSRDGPEAAGDDAVEDDTDADETDDGAE